jgi:hypothetical protein
MPDLVKDYDVIGFDMDSSIISYNTLEMVKLLVQSYLKSLHQDVEGYPQEVLNINYQT